MPILSFHSLNGQSLINVLVLGLFLASRQAFLELSYVFLFPGSTFALVLTHACEAIAVLSRLSDTSFIVSGALGEEPLTF